MMPTPFENLYTAIQAMMAAVATASPETITLAPSNYGTDFRVTSANAFYQVQISPNKDYGANSNSSHPSADVAILIHHHKTLAADEIAFLHETMSHAADTFLVNTKWQAEAGIFDLDPEEEPEISEASREGLVTSFEITATVLMDAV